MPGHIPFVGVLGPGRLKVNLTDGTSKVLAVHSGFVETSSDHVTMGTALGLNAAEFTLECWFKWNGGGSTSNTGTGGIFAYPLVTKGRGETDNSVVDMNYLLGILASGQLAADFEEHTSGGSPGLNHPVQGTTVVTTGVWHHAAVTYDGNENTTGNIRFYWTRVDATRTEANEISGGLLSMQTDLGGDS